MSKRYTQTDKDHMARIAINAAKELQELGGQYPSFKNYVWAAQHILNGGTPNNKVDEFMLEKIREAGLL
ncbi:hypothetical protein [Methylomonas methanica]|uniref:hypothetical protein n=1 Tax=Methylomonas methanica TaxID=421 RepID=UPI0012F6F518|nr:hypothetical protein [Methylomonas methanica]